MKYIFRGIGKNQDIFPVIFYFSGGLIFFIKGIELLKLPVKLGNIYIANPEAQGHWLAKMIAAAAERTRASCPIRKIGIACCINKIAGL